MMPMPDGVRLATDIYRPKNAPDKVPTIWVRTPYNFNFWDVHNGVPADMTAALTAVKRGYAYVVQNERGHFFSEGNYDILGSKTDGYNTVDWLTKQPWSNGKVGTTGCSSTAEYQMGVAALGHPGYAAMNVQGFGAGVGRVGPYYEQGNWYRGGAVQMLFIAWLYGEQNQVRPMFPPEHVARGSDSRVEVVRPRAASAAGRLVEGAAGTCRCRTSSRRSTVRAASSQTRCRSRPAAEMIQRAPNDPAWYRGGLYHDDQKLNVPGLWFMSWYDVSVGPNLALYNHVRKTASPAIADEQWAVDRAGGALLAYTRATEDTIVGERSMGDARLDYNEIVYGFFDRFLKGEKNARLESLPKVTYFTMGINKWQTSDTWPPAGAQPMTFYPVERRQGELALRVTARWPPAAPDADRPDALHLRSDESGAVVRRQRLLHRQRGAGRRVRPAAHGSAPGHPRLHLGAVQ